MGTGLFNGCLLESEENLKCGEKKADAQVADENRSFVAVEKVWTPSFLNFKT